MKILHTADLHIGKSVNGFSMLEDQEYILNQILQAVRKYNPEAVIIAGDVYDKPLPSAEAVALLDNFLTELNTETFIISGNHDSADRLAFGGRLMSRAGVHIAPVYDGKIDPIIFGGAAFYLIPFLKPSTVRHFTEQSDVNSYADALRAVVGEIELQSGLANIAVAHQFITGAEKSGAEEISVGGLDDIPWKVFEHFDYTALGHIHRAQKVGRENICYSGSPLKYSFSEAGHVKSVSLIELDGTVRSVCRLPLKPLHDMRSISGTYDEITAKDNYVGSDTEDYVRIILNDKNEIPDAIGRLRSIYPNIMELSYDNLSVNGGQNALLSSDTERKSPSELFAELFEAQNGRAMDENQKNIVEKIVKSIWEGEE